MTTSDYRLAFGQFELDPATGDLHGPAGLVRLTPKALALLLHLVTHAGRLVSKHELLDTLWPDVFVTEGVLKVCVRQIRHALDDDAHAPRFVETAHRRGYRFMAPVRRVDGTGWPPPRCGDGPAATVTPSSPTWLPGSSPRGVVGRARHAAEDYAAHALIDATVDAIVFTVRVSLGGAREHDDSPWRALRLHTKVTHTGVGRLTVGYGTALDTLTRVAGDQQQQQRGA